ncbi:hypothetical protein MUO71_01300 [Candidatus Bathyarchaeota archaeon]|nr:hypothetical protein [Candidatus Bathyarchaeota archaeon]
MSDPVKYFETKLKGLCLAELQAYKKRLDESITEKIAKTAPNEQIAPLILYRGILEHEMKRRMNQK